MASWDLSPGTPPGRRQSPSDVTRVPVRAIVELLAFADGLVLLDYEAANPHADFVIIAVAVVLMAFPLFGERFRARARVVFRPPPDVTDDAPDIQSHV